jgi:S-formylglutathione hydrolase
VKYFQHQSKACDSEMTFSIYLPKQAIEKKLPAILWLSGLTCNHENFISKAGAQQYADEHGIILIMPDTSPRNVGVAGADNDYDLGYGAGFYVNATQVPWQKNFSMDKYIIKELLPLCCAELPINPDKISIMGHSMGGHGAMVLALRHPELFQSVSAFAPICAPSQTPWGEKAFKAYLGDDRNTWLEYDSCYLIQQGAMKLPLRVEQGGADQFLAEQLKPELLQEVCTIAQYPLEYYFRDGFDHSYYFIASFIGEHMAFHAAHLACTD